MLTNKKTDVFISNLATGGLGMIKAKTENMRKCRILKGVNQTEFAKIISLNTASYCLIENGKLGVKPKTAKVITDELAVEFDEIFEIIQ